MKIKVTQEDIEKGTPMDPFNCPIARAVKREFPEADYDISVAGYVRVRYLGNHSIFPWRRKKGYVKDFELSKAARAFIRNYDAYRDPTLIKPREFEITEIQ